MNIYNNYSLANCTKNFMIFCIKRLLKNKTSSFIIHSVKINKNERRK